MTKCIYCGKETEIGTPVCKKCTIEFLHKDYEKEKLSSKESLTMSEKKQPQYPEEMQELSMELTLDGYDNSIKFLYGKWVCIVEGKL